MSYRTMALASGEVTSGRPGVLPDSQLLHLIESGALGGDRPFEPGQVQPNSIDLRLGTVAHRTRCSFLPVGQPVAALLQDFKTNSVPLEDDGFVIDFHGNCQGHCRNGYGSHCTIHLYRKR